MSKTPSSSPANGRFMSVFAGQTASPPPIWLMRQAGRYLPEYREVRGKAGSFLNLCYSPELAAEVTLQPIRRYGFDAAILFSDILVVPHALGQKVEFMESEGPRLDPIQDSAGLVRLDQGATSRIYQTICETVERVRGALPSETALIGFCGAPWTVATYMVAGRGTSDQAPARLFAYRDPDTFGKLIDLLVETSIDYLSRQVAAGANALQIFDTWAGVLAEDQFESWVVQPTKRIVAAIKERHPGVPIIGFPRGAGVLGLDYALETGVEGIGCDTAMPVYYMKEAYAEENLVVQGNLDPLLLVTGGELMERRVAHILETMHGQRHIFNLGHGIVPQTPPENVGRLVELVRRGVSA